MKKLKITLRNYQARPKQRPRIGKGGRVYSPSGKDEQSLAWLIKAQALNQGWQSSFVFRGNIRVDLDIVGDLLGDKDNYEKFVFDALQKSGVISNDRQIRDGRTRLVQGHPKLTIAISEYVGYDGPAEKRKACQVLRGNGMTYRAIGKKLGISHTMARKYCATRENNG